MGEFDTDLTNLMRARIALVPGETGLDAEHNIRKAQFSGAEVYQLFQAFDAAQEGVRRLAAANLALKQELAVLREGR